MFGHRRVLAVITARGGSKGFPGKNIRLLAGLPLIGWTIQSALASRYIDRTILSSDDPQIIATANSLGCEAPFVRSSDLASDTATSIDVVLDALDRVPGYDIVVLLQPTSPLRTVEDIDGTIALLESASAAVSVTEAPTHPWFIHRPDPHGYLRPYVEETGASTRRQDLPPALMINGAVYAAEATWLKTERTFIRTGQTRFLTMSPERSLDIDTLADFQKAEDFCASQTPTPRL